MLENPFSIIERQLNRLESLLLVLTENHKNSTPEQEKPLNIQQAAEYLTLAVPTIYAMVSRKEIPVRKRGGRLYFNKAELDKWLEGGRKKTVSEIEAEAVAGVVTKRRG